MLQRLSASLANNSPIPDDEVHASSSASSINEEGTRAIMEKFKHLKLLDQESGEYRQLAINEIENFPQVDIGQIIEEAKTLVPVENMEI